MKNGKLLPENVSFLPTVYRAEIEIIKKRRNALNIVPREDREGEIRARALEPHIPEKAPFDMMGIALSGGGIRSATINLGFLKVLNDNNVLRLSDYLSTVSGGGYTGSYVTEKLRLGLETKGGCQSSDPYSTLFSQEDIEHIKQHGSYLVPGKKGWEKLRDKIILVGGFIATALLHLIWYLLVFALIFYLFKIIHLSLGRGTINGLVAVAVAVFSGAACYYYFFHGLRFFSCWPVKKLITALSLSLAVILFFYLIAYTGSLPQLGCGSPYFYLAMLLTAVLFLGIFANPNILSPSQIYRFRLEEAFRWFGDKRRKLCDISPDCTQKDWGPAPYPLINTTLNLSGAAQPQPNPEGKSQGQEEKQTNLGKKVEGKLPYIGFKTCDYFILSPFYCGSKLTGFLPTDRSEYRLMTLSTAVTISGAALNPEMGYKSSKLTAFFMTLLNLRLGYWALNPYLFRRQWNSFDKLAFEISKLLAKCNALKYFWPTYWPVYNIYELFDMSGIDRWRVNLSDGGHIENLGVFELLRRKLRLIIGIDAGADPDYTFSDLKNLVARARNELGIELRFRTDPEKIIKPSASLGFSERQFCIADIYDLPREQDEPKTRIGIFVYVKASVTPQKVKDPKNNQKSYTYRLYHPKFPHEPTSDQFFDKAQWEAYYETGKEMANAFIKECAKGNPEQPGKFPKSVSLERLLQMVDAIDSRFK